MPRTKTATAAAPLLELTAQSEPAQKTKPKSKGVPVPSAVVAIPAEAKPAPLPVHKPADPTNMLAVIARAAADPKVNPENMRLLLDMQKEIATEEARRAFTDSFVALQSDLPVINAKGRIEIKKDGRILQSTPYATFNEINRVTKPLLSKHGFTLSFATDASEDGTRLIVRGFLDHIKGHQRTTSFPLPAETSGSKNNVQGWGSSLSYGKRYATIALLNLVSESMEDRDTDGNDDTVVEPNRITIQQSSALVDLIKTSGVTLERFLDKYQIKAVIDLDPKLYETAVKACKDFQAQAAAKGAR